MIADLGGREPGGNRRHELAGPETLTYEQIDAADRALRRAASGRSSTSRSNLVHARSARRLERVVGDAAFATWEEAELMEVPMVSRRGTGRRQRARGRAAPMAEVLGAIGD